MNFETSLVLIRSQSGSPIENSNSGNWESDVSDVGGWFVVVDLVGKLIQVQKPTDLERATNGFKKKLGAGGFGMVYKGILASGKVVAVKQLEGVEQGEKHFRIEVGTVIGTHHLN
ncbi:hypothetical protein LguiB_009837 [Lonicera macranthoides]